MPRLAAPPTFQPNSSPLAATESTLADQRVVVPSIKKRGHVLPDVAPSRHVSRSTSLRNVRKPHHHRASSLNECALEKPLEPEKLARCQSRAPLPPTPYLRWNYGTSKRARTMWAHRWEARHDITYKNTPWELRNYSVPVNSNLCRLDPETEVVTSLISYGAPLQQLPVVLPSELKLRLKKDKGSGKNGSSIWKAETPWDDDLRNDRYMRKFRREQTAILEQVNAISSSGKTETGRKGKTRAKGERQWKWHCNW